MIFIWTTAVKVFLLVTIIAVLLFVIGFFLDEEEFSVGCFFVFVVAIIIFFVLGFNSTSTAIKTLVEMKLDHKQYENAITVKEYLLNTSDDKEILSLELEDLKQKRDKNLKDINLYTKALNKKFYKLDKKRTKKPVKEEKLQVPESFVEEYYYVED